MIKLKPLFISLLISLGVGGLSAFLTMDSMNIYQNLNKPLLAPPTIVFPIVWTILFFLMGISSYLIYISKNPSKYKALGLYIIQLFFNFVWSLIFFNAELYLLAFIWLIFLWVFILLMIINFYKIKPLSAYLQIPYLVWVTFAGYLNFMVYWLNN